MEESKGNRKEVGIQMVSPVLSPVYLLRSYAWAVLKANMPETWDETKYGGMTPIVPLSEEPELDEFDGPHIVYGYSLDSTGSLHARKSGSMTFAVYDQNFRRLTETLTNLQTAFERQDETAKDVNRYTTARPQFIGLRFGYIFIGFVEGGTPEETEGARQSALINIRFEYYVDYDVVTAVI
jgi:hypothetical protein